MNHRLRTRLFVRALEDRTVPAAFTVMNLNDSGTDSLRDCIDKANAAAGADTVAFNSGLTGTITLTSGEIAISQAVTINGPGASVLAISGNNANRILNISTAPAAASIVISGLTLTGGFASGFDSSGGAIRGTNQSLQVAACVFSGNKSAGTFNGIGGAIVLTNGSLAATNSSFTGNTAATRGGALAIQSTGSKLTLDACTLSGNSSGDGGGVYVNDNLTIQNSTFSGNTADGGGGGTGSGGGILALGSFAAGITIINSTFSGNSASFGGGGIAFANSNATMTIRNSTITANSAANRGGGIARTSGTGTIALESSIVSGNTNVTSPDIYSPGTVNVKTSAVGSGTGFTKTDQGGNLAFGTNLKLGPLQNNGGPTLTHTPAIDSPLVSAGSNPAALTNDQRGIGFPRVLGTAPEIGATEVLSLVVSNTNNSGNGSLRQAILDANAVSGPNTVSFDPTVFSLVKTITLTTGEIAISDALTIAGTGSSKLSISGNNASRIFNTSTAPLNSAINLNDLTLTLAKSAGQGGAILSGDESLTLTNCVFTSNITTATGGAAVAMGDNNPGGKFKAVDCRFVNNTASGFGGALNLYSFGLEATLTRCTISGNKATTAGGIYVSGDLVMEACTVSGNTATNGGGGLQLSTYYDPTAVFTIRNSTISGNSGTNGGGIDLSNFGTTIQIQNSTITNNTATGKGGGIWRMSGTGVISLESSIVSGNAAPLFVDIYCSGTPVTMKTSAVGNGGFTKNDLGGNLPFQPHANLKLGVLNDNGGPTQTHMLLAGSPCVDVGSNPAGLAGDQRGLARTFNGTADMGAFEVNPQTFVVDQVVDENDGNFAKGDLSLREALLLANGFPNTSDTISFDNKSFIVLNQITLTLGQLVVTSPVEIEWTNTINTAPLTINANNASRVLSIDGSPAGTNVKLTNLQLTGGKVSGSGGAILTNDENLTLSKCVLTGNRATTSFGGAIALVGDGSLAATDCEFINNTASSSGGAICEIGGGYAKLNLTRCTISGNSGFQGGGIYTRGIFFMDACTVSNNTAVSDAGGGIQLGQQLGIGTDVIRNSTISGNKGEFGGGVVVITTFGGTLLVQNCTITNNHAMVSGGGINHAGAKGTIDINSSIVSGNSAPTEGPDIRSQNSVNVNFSAIGDSNGFPLSGSKNLPFNTDLKLGPLQLNGGPTATHAIMAGSPLLDKGSISAGLTSDQRGLPYKRSIGSAPDIGAYETAKVFLVTNTNDSGPGSLRQAALNADQDASIPGLVRFDPTVFSTPQTLTLTTGDISMFYYVEIQGPGAALVTISGNNNDSHFFVGGTFSASETIFSGLTLTAGKGTHGGSIAGIGQSTIIRDCVLTGNTATVGGGAISINTGKLVMERCTVANNTATTYGGGLYFFSRSAFTIADSTISGNNVTSGEGGGIYFFNAYYAPTVIRNSTISGNASKFEGGGIALNFRGNLIVQNSTVTKNSSQQFGGGIGRFGGQGKITLQSTIVAQNTALIPDVHFDTATTIGCDNSIIGVANVGNFTIVGTGNQTGTATTPVDAKLSALGNFGGPTRTHVPVAGSPAVDKGANPFGLTFDQRGLPRIFNNTADVGAVEVHPQVLVVDITADENDGNFEPLDLSLREAIALANASSATTDTISFDSTVFASMKTITLGGTEISISGPVNIDGPSAKVSVNGNSLSRIFNTQSAPAGAAISISNMTMTMGKPGSIGGALLGTDEAISLINCTLSNNTGTTGGAVNISGGGSFVATDCAFLNNAADTIGAIDVYGTGAKTKLTRCTVSGTTQQGFGSIYVQNYLILDSSTISGNTSTLGVSGGIYAEGAFGAGSLVIRNSTISGNSAKTDGGGIFLSNVTGTLVVQNSTIAFNSASGKGGGIFASDATPIISLESSIVSKNTNTGSTSPDIFTTGKVEYKTSSIFSLNGITTLADFGGNRPFSEDPLLLPLANNGGPTETHALQFASPVINHGSNPASLLTDQRSSGFSRDAKGVDMGAFEFQFPSCVVGNTVIVNGGDAQRSRVTIIQIDFDQVVTLPAMPETAFELKRQSDGMLVDLTAKVVDDTATHVSLTFNGALSEAGSLADGRYTLTIFNSKVSNSNGNLDGDCNGIGGDDFILASAGTTGIFRLFGDADGNATVNSTDFAVFRTFFGLGASMFDFNGDAQTNSNDFAEFRKRFGVSV